MAHRQSFRDVPSSAARATGGEKRLALCAVASDSGRPGRRRMDRDPELDVTLSDGVTGWRTPSEILPLAWRQVDLKAGEVRLDAGATKNGESRVFPFTTALRRVLDDQQTIADRLQREQGIIARYVFCYTTGQKAGQRITESGFNKAWRKARLAAG